MPTAKTLVALPCSLSPGALSGERVIEVKLADGRIYTSLVPRYFCWNAAGQLVGENEPSAEIDGMVAARRVDELDDTQVAVEIPDGKVIAVDRSQIRPRPTPIKPPSVTPLNSAVQ
jgi:hypothetical protein